jgi:hypothetical protein
MTNLGIGSLPITISYLVMSGTGLHTTNGALGQGHPYRWEVASEPQVRLESGIHAGVATPQYVMRASEEASFTKAFRRSPRIVSRGRLR